MLYFQYDNFNYMKWKTYNAKLDNYGVIGLLEQILEDLDVKKGFAIVDSFSYCENVGMYFRTINKLSDYILYNKYYQRLIDLDEVNREIERINEKLKRTKEVPKQKTKTRTKKDKVVISKSIDLFDGSPVFIYDNLNTGEVKVSHDTPIEERNYKDLTGVIFNFNIVKK